MTKHSSKPTQDVIENNDDNLAFFSQIVGECIDEVQGNCAPGNKVCPSAGLEHATHVLGLRKESGIIEFFPNELPLTSVAIEVLTLEDQHTRVRFAGPCIRTSCVHWKDGCSLGWAISQIPADSVSRVLGDKEICPIKDRCRWIAENGESACSNCQHILHVPIIEKTKESDNG